MLTDLFGVYGVRIINKELGKEMIKVGPEMIEYDRKTKTFHILLDVQHPFEAPIKIIEFFVRKGPDTINYK